MCCAEYMLFLKYAILNSKRMKHNHPIAGGEEDSHE